LHTEDGCLIGKCLDGDPDAFGFLVDKYKSAVFALAYSNLGNFHDAQDLTQEVFIEAYQNLHKLRYWDKFAFWLYRIASNKGKNAVRAKSKRPDREFLEDQEPGLFEDISINSYREGAIYESVSDILESLEETDRQIVMLHYFGGMTSSEISNFSGISPSAVRKRLRKARILLKGEVLSRMGEAFKNKLPVSFTFNIMDIVKHIRVKPLPKVTGISWGISIALGIAIFGASLSVKLPEAMVYYDNSMAPRVSKLTDTDEVPVVIVNQPKTTSRDSVFTVAQGNMDGDSPGVTEWTKYGNGFVLGTDPEAWDNKDISDPAVIYDGGVYRMWYGGSDGENWRIGYAISADGIDWQKYGGNPVVDLGKPGEWDDFYVGGPSVIFHKESGIYEMWYYGSDGRDQRVGYAISTDGVNWEKYGGNPVLDTGESWEWDGHLVSYPTVIFHDNLYRMWYQGNNYTQLEIGYATSTNGIDWQKYSGNPVLRLGNSGKWDNAHIMAPTVIHDGISYKMWYSGEDGCSPKIDESRVFPRIGYATSTDGIVWKKQASPVLNPRGWDKSGLQNPDVLYDGKKYKMWYAGDDGEHFRIGYATARVDNTSVLTDDTPNAPLNSEAFAPFPQPANPEVWIPYRISQSADVNITIYDIDGKVIRILNLGHQPTGQHISKEKAAYWDGRDEAGEQVASGVYFYIIHAGDSFTATKKLMVSR